MTSSLKPLKQAQQELSPCGHVCLYGHKEIHSISRHSLRGARWACRRVSQLHSCTCQRMSQKLSGCRYSYITADVTSSFPIEQTEKKTISD